MEGRILTKEILKGFNDYLLNDEKSKNTIDKYIRDSKKLVHHGKLGDGLRMEGIDK